MQKHKQRLKSLLTTFIVLSQNDNTDVAAMPAWWGRASSLWCKSYELGETPTLGLQRLFLRLTTAGGFLFFFSCGRLLILKKGGNGDHQEASRAVTNPVAAAAVASALRLSACIRQRRRKAPSRSHRNRREKKAETETEPQTSPKRVFPPLRGSPTQQRNL